ncbi:MAG: 50S ribosomal protein L28 [Planctomycetota bacterium]|jgi:large subunit ribosomal protein L28|nr:50S ribosomal protein L28 [Planctomycetota bacterium]
MSCECEVCGKKRSVGNSISRRGKAKYLGGVGKKITGITRRQFRPNLQRLKVVIDGAVRRARVCTQCLRSGRVQRPQRKNPFQLPV